MKFFRCVFWLLFASATLWTGTVRAQYDDSNQINTISGVVSNWAGDYVIDFPYLSTGGGADALLIQSGGILSDSNGYIGPHNDNNLAMVSGSGSIWNNSGDLYVGGNSDFDQLIITNGGVVYDDNGIIGYPSPYFGGYSVLVAGSGSVWSNRNDLTMYTGRTIAIANGGMVFNNNASIEAEQNALITVTDPGSAWSVNGTLTIAAGFSMMVITNGAVMRSGDANITGSQFSTLVTGTGSVWAVEGDLNITGDYNNRLTVADGGIVKVSSSVALANNGSITISGGALYITNGLGMATLGVKDATLTVNSGTVALDQLITSSTRYSSIVFNGGVLRSKATTIISNSANSAFTVGDGTDAATFILDTGGSGFHSFANGLMISSNGALRGVGTIIGSTTFNAGGLLAPGMSPGSITFSNSLTLAPNSTFAVELDGRAEGQYDRIIALDTVTLSNSILSVSLGFTPSIGDSFTIISNLSAMAVLGTFITSDGAALPDGAEFSADGTTFQIDYTANPDGQDVVLTAVIPEPSSLLLSVAGMMGLWSLRKRRRLLNRTNVTQVE